MSDLRQTPQYAKYLENLGWIVKRKNRTNYFIKQILIVGSAIKVQRAEKIDYQYIDALAVKCRAFQITIEPIHTNHQSPITSHGYRLSKSPSLPSKTVRIDLAKSEKQLLAEMHHKTRYNIKKAARNKLQVASSEDIEKFAEFWQECALHQRGMFLSQKNEIKEIYKAFGEKANLVFALQSKELVSGILVLHADKISYYMYAASSKKGKKLYAPTLNAWEAIRLSRNHGSKYFDFEGIYDKRFPIKTWKGFTRFKKSFGGQEVEYPGAFVRYRIPI